MLLWSLATIFSTVWVGEVALIVIGIYYCSSSLGECGTRAIQAISGKLAKSASDIEALEELVDLRLERARRQIVHRRSTNHCTVSKTDPGGAHESIAAAFHPATRRNRGSLVSERFDGIQLRRFHGGPDAKDQADADAYGDSGGRGPQRNDSRPVQQDANQKHKQKHQ